MSNDKRYNVEISYGTFARTADEAIFAALSVVADRTGGYVSVTEDETNQTVLEAELPAMDVDATVIGDPVEAEEGEDTQFNVVLSNTTHASNPKEAVEISLSAIDARNGAYIEVFNTVEDESVIEGELPVVVPTPKDQSKVAVIFDPNDNYITEASSIRVKGAFRQYFEETGVVPAHADNIADESVRALALAHQEEFGEACENFESEAGFTK